MAEIKFEITQHIGVLSESAKGWRKELNLASWNGREPKFDIRKWAPEYAKVVSRFFRKFISSASKYRHQMYGFSSSTGCSIPILNRCSMSI